MRNLLQNKLTLPRMLDMGIRGSVLQKTGRPPKIMCLIRVFYSAQKVFFVYPLCRQDGAGKEREVKSRDRRDKEDNFPKTAFSFHGAGLLRTQKYSRPA